MRSIIGALLRNSRGATAVEYGLLITLIALAAFAGILAFADGTSRTWNGVSSASKSNL